jgi:hypothetical protein
MLRKRMGGINFVTDNVYFYMNNGDRQVRCGITRSALEVLAPELPHTKQAASRRSHSAEPVSSIRLA